MIHEQLFLILCLLSLILISPPVPGLQQIFSPVPSVTKSSAAHIFSAALLFSCINPLYLFYTYPFISQKEKSDKFTFVSF